MEEEAHRMCVKEFVGGQCVRLFTVQTHIRCGIVNELSILFEKMG